MALVVQLASLGADESLALLVAVVHIRSSMSITGLHNDGLFHSTKACTTKEA